MFKPIVSLFCGTSLALAGCAGFPHLPDEPNVSITDILTNVECEIQQALSENVQSYPWLLLWAANLTLNLDTNRGGGGAGNIDLSIPLTPETFTLSLGAAPNSNHNSTASLKHSFYLKNLEQCSADATAKKASFLTGYTGVGRWIIRVAEAFNAIEDCPEEINFSLEFKISLGLDGKPAISGIQAGDGTLGGSLTLNHDDSQTHKISVSMKKISAADDTGNYEDALEAIDLRLPGLTIEAPNKCGPAVPRQVRQIVVAPAPAPKTRVVAPPVTQRAPVVVQPPPVVQTPAVVQPSRQGPQDDVDPATQRSLDEASQRFLLQDLIDEIDELDR